MDHYQKVKIINFISDKYFANSKEDEASSTLTNFIRESKGEIFDDSPWILSWIMKDPKKREAMSPRLNSHQKLYVYIDLFIKRNRFSIQDYEEDKLCQELAIFDLVSKAEYLAEIALKIRIFDRELSIYLINQAWGLVRNEKDWAETCAKISVFTVAMEIWDFETIDTNFVEIRKTIVRNNSDELSIHLRETLLSCNSNRFSSNGC